MMSDHTPATYRYAVTHVFLPVRLAATSDYTVQNDLSLARAACAAAHAYSPYADGTSGAQWPRIVKMLDNLQTSLQSEHLDKDQVVSQLRAMQTGDIFAFLVRPRNAAVVLEKRWNRTVLESFEVSLPDRDAVKKTTTGALICSYPDSAVEMSNQAFNNGGFQSELADLLSLSKAAGSDRPLPPIPTSLTGILRGDSRTADVPRVMKHVRDNMNTPKEDWHRSPLWLFIRVAIQISLDRSPFGRASYKLFMLFFVCTLARDANNTDLPSDLLHLMSYKILRRLSKLCSPSPQWLSEMALKTSTCLAEILDGRQNQLTARTSPFRNPSQDELRRDTQTSLLGCREYIHNTPAGQVHNFPHTPFHPNHRPRGTIDNFLSSDGTFFEDAYRVDRVVALYDLERSVEQGIDDWLSHVTNVNEACIQLEILMDKYLGKAEDDSRLSCNPEDTSIAFLTTIELFVALDKLVSKEVPMFADYSPELPISVLEKQLLRRTSSLHRLARSYQYLAARHSRSRPGWSILSDEFTEDSFPVRYYDQSLRLQQLKARIERDAESASLASGAFRSPLPFLPLHTKVVVFELQCPACIRSWRSVVARILSKSVRLDCSKQNTLKEDNLLAHVHAFQPYFVEYQMPPLDFQVRFACLSPKELQLNSPTLYYVQQTPGYLEAHVVTWGGNKYDCTPFPDFEDELENRMLGEYVDSTFHTSNNVLASQSRCPVDMTLDQFIAFGHLRSGGSLQWLNILHGLRSRSLNLHRHDVHYLLAFAAFQVGPLDLNTGAWVWHKELQESSFCDALLDELDDLLTEAGAGSIDSVIMGSISLLLTRVLASSPSERTSERVVAHLRGVCRKTFQWVQELSYDLTMAPTNEERCQILRDMASTCRGTFDVNAHALHGLFRSAEGVAALLSCALFTFTPHVIYPAKYYKMKFNLSNSAEYSRMLLQRDSRLAHILEGILGDFLFADVSDYGIDLAVGKTFANHKPSTHGWLRLAPPNDRWVACETRDQPSQTVHLNLLNGALQVHDRPLFGPGLPDQIKHHDIYQQIFRDQGFFVTLSNLPGMDYTTLATTSKHKVHFALRDRNPVVRAECDETNEILELVPSEDLKEDLPLALVEDHVHWLNLSTNIIEIRPLRRLWEQSPEAWRISCTPGHYRIYKAHETLVDVRSPTWSMISKCFQCLKTVDRVVEHQSRDLLVTVTPIRSSQGVTMLRLSVALPQYGLSFFVNEEGQLESHDFKGMVYDENQSIGTLFGLENLLALRQKTHLPEGLIHRHVLIPNGRPERLEDHRVRVAPPGALEFIGSDGRLFHTYTVDTELGCLVGNGSFASTRYLAYLHLVTSSHSPDPLTGKTGYQAALCLLQSAGFWSIVKLKAHNEDGYNDVIHDDLSWTSTHRPQIKLACQEIRHRYCGNLWGRHENPSWGDQCASQRAGYLPLWHATGSTPSEGRDHSDRDCSTAHVPTAPGPCTSPRHVSDCDTLQLPITLDQLLSDRPAPELPARCTLPRLSSKILPDDVPQLDQLLGLLISKSDASFHQEYITRLSVSTQYIREERQTVYKIAKENQIEILETHYMKCSRNYSNAIERLQESLGPMDDLHEQVLNRFGQWPPITADVLLRHLAPASQIDIPPSWKECLISLALLLLDLQRARRLLRFALDHHEDELLKELQNQGCDGWKAEDYPEWLLIQIQGDFLIRRTQAEIAMEMMSPKSDENTVFQVNMGEGKSSVIIPIIAAALANGKQLVRVIVPKALTAQMFGLLVARLGGFTNRPIYHLPFSRTTEHNKHGEVLSLGINDLQELMSRCMVERGILLVQPEHVMSLKLMGVDEQIRMGKCGVDPLAPKVPRFVFKHILMPKLLPEGSLLGRIVGSLSRPSNHSGGKAALLSDTLGVPGPHPASKWQDLQKWIHSHVRDVLDESDEVLHSRFQLMYTLGHQQHMDGYPDRWTTAQQILRLVKGHAYSLSRYSSDSIEYEPGPPGSFPHIRIIRAPDVGQRLISCIVEDVMAGRLSNFHLCNDSKAPLRAIRSFISEENILPTVAKRVEDYAKGSHQGFLWRRLLLLRGLLASNILLFALAERRWRVDYGLDLHPRGSHRHSRTTMLAVPYRAKDVPASNTQFGHPDITIVLTCLSYYYTGLSEEQLRTCFEILLDQDDTSTEYARWVKEYGFGPVPDTVRKLGEINLKSSEQWDEVISPIFARNQAVIDFYLSRVVFPNEAKEFSQKLTGSSWDLAEKRDKVITGFSGTDDGRWLLPMSIAQRDLDDQQGTNAKVIAYLLHPKNDSYILTHEGGERRTTIEFLQMVAMQQPEIRVFLDVGAQILDLDNDQVAKAWLDLAGDAAGAVYFDNDDELVVLTRNGIIQSMRSSPLAQRLDSCVVYLDHAHTRGTDIKLPIGSRAAVTLGPKVTKDRLVQGCMRMRKLGHGHSVMFFAPSEVDRSIRAAVGKEDPNTLVTNVDVLCWAVRETWTDVKQRAPYWAKQGMSHKTRSDAWIRFCNDEAGPDQLSDAWLQQERKPLADLYAPCEAKNASSSLSSLDPEFQQRCKDLGVLSLQNIHMEEEQEREVLREREREREVELPPEAEPSEHYLHSDVIKFVNTGEIPPLHTTSAFLPIFTTLENSTATTHDVGAWSPSLLATVDFCQTIKPDSTQGTMDQYLRPVQWILSRENLANRDPVLVVLSPFEAKHLIPHVRESHHVHLHLYAPRTSRRMRPSDDLKLYSIPPLPPHWSPPWALMDQLSVFAGQLYLRDSRSYLRLCRFLDVHTEDSPNDAKVRQDSVNIASSLEGNGNRFSSSPLPFVEALLSIRNRGRPFTGTHMGRILQGELLTEKDFERPMPGLSAASTC